MTDLPFPLFTSCRYIINDKIPNKDGELFKLFTNKLNFKISSIEPLIIEKDWPSQEDLTTLVEALKSLLPPNSDNWNLEQRQRESFQLQATTDEEGQFTENTGNDARGTDLQAMGKNNDQHGLTKIYHLKRKDMSTDLLPVSANKCVENVSSEDTTEVSADSRVKDILPTPVYGTYSGDNESHIFTKTHNAYYVNQEKSKLKVKILKTDITKLEVDCIVNAANKRMQQFGEVSKAISSAAGPALNKECEAFRDSGSLVAVTDIFISTAGKMPAKYVMHAVGPKWDAYDDNSKPQCSDDLRHTVIRCLVEAGRQGFTSIAFSSISAAIFRVPKEACARCYMEAVKHFGTFNKERTSLREIYFVDVDDYMVKIIQDHFEKSWTNPCNPHIVQRDGDFASAHIYSPTRNAAQNSEQSPHTSKTASSSVSAKKSGANKSSYVPGVSSTSDKSGEAEASSAYQFGKYTLCTDTRPAFDLSSDITVTVGKPFDKLSEASDAESQHYLTYSMKASSLDGLKKYFKEPIYDKYFDDAKNEGTSFTFKLNSSDKNAGPFLKKLIKLKVEEYDFGHKDYLEAAVKDIEAKIDGLVTQVNGSTVHIVGLRDSVTSAKKKLQNHKQKINLDIIKNDEYSATRKNQEVPRNEISDSKKTYGLVRSQEAEYKETDLEEPQSPRLGHDFSFHSSSLPVNKNHFGENERSIFSQNNKNYYLTTELSTFSVKICKTDITKLEVDCIVNAANKRLQHFGGVEKAISSAAGPSLQKECETFRASGSLVDVTDIFISTAGKMPAKCVMHAVGPKWDAYDDNSKPQCSDDLRHTVIRCLVEAGRQGFTSIAFSSISAAIFRVPKEACARCYMEAVKHFGTFNKERTSLHEIYFVDVDDSMVKVIQDHFEKNWTNPCIPHIVQRDRDFASTHFYSPNRNAAKKSEPSPYANKTASSSISTNTPGLNKPAYVPGNSSAGPTVSSPSDKRREESVTYQIGNFTLRTDSRPAFDIPSDITITVGKPFDKLSGLPNFSVSANKQKKGKESVKNKYTLFNVSKPKGHQHKLVCALLPEPDDEETIKQALENLWAILQSPNHKIFAQKIAKVILTSSILYKEPNNFPDKKIQHSYDRKKFGHFAKCLFEFLNSASEMSMISVTVVGSEEALLTVHRVMESRKVKKISPEAQQGARSKNSESSQHYNKGGYSAHHSGYAGEGSDYTRHYLGEGHYKASSMTMDSSEYSSLGAFSKQNSRYPVQDADDYDGDVGSPVDVEKTTCEICTFEKPCYPLKCCGKLMCQKCQNKVTLCPYCRTFWRVLTGNQPPGTMSVHIMQVCVAGFEQFPTLEITYFFPSGVQKDCHPNPGHRYSPMIRRAYLPANDHGFLVLKLLRLAFLRKLTFTIGRSLTTDRENSITWNDIHHKTSLRGGNFSYPDPNYLNNVSQELARKGVLLETASADERRNIDNFEYRIRTSGYFSDF